MELATPPPRREPSFASAFVHAYAGLLHALGQRNMKFHVVSGVLVGLVGSGIPLGLAEKVTLVFCVLLIFFAEILNTALEALVDLHTEDIRDLARITKDTAAAGVLVLSVGTVLLFATILVYNAPTIASHGPAIARQFALGVPIATIVGVMLRHEVRAARSELHAHALYLLGLALVAAQLPVTESYVFTSIVFMLLTLAWRFAIQRAREAAAARGTNPA